MLNHPCIPGVKLTLSWCMIFLMFSWTWVADFFLLRVFIAISFWRWVRDFLFVFPFLGFCTRLMLTVGELSSGLAYSVLWDTEAQWCRMVWWTWAVNLVVDFSLLGDFILLLQPCFFVIFFCCSYLTDFPVDHRCLGIYTFPTFAMFLNIKFKNIPLW